LSDGIFAPTEIEIIEAGETMSIKFVAASEQYDINLVYQNDLVDTEICEVVSKAIDEAYHRKRGYKPLLELGSDLSKGSIDPTDVNITEREKNQRYISL